jgi:hypothetical protein
MYFDNSTCMKHGMQPHYNGKCAICLQEDEAKRKREFLAPMEGKTTQEQLDHLKEMLYSHFQNHPSGFMTDMIGMGH